MENYACNYALIRFLPHRETGEFVNIGIALACAQTGYLNFAIERKRFARVTHFFPELAAPVYREGLRALDEECQRWHQSARRFAQKQPENGEAIMRHIFGELTRARESVFHFSQPRVIMANDPAAKLEELFIYYVRRQFVTDEIRGEEALRQRIAQSLRALGVERVYQETRIGTQDYAVRFPFVARDFVPLQMPLHGTTDDVPVATARKAIKPLNLDRRDPSEVTQHGDDWIAKIRRLQKLNVLPEQVLFPVQEPAGSGRTWNAAQEICKELQDLGIQTINAENHTAFARFVQFNTAQ